MSQALKTEALSQKTHIYNYTKKHTKELKYLKEIFTTLVLQYQHDNQQKYNTSNKLDNNTGKLRKKHLSFSGVNTGRTRGALRTL